VSSTTWRLLHSSDFQLLSALSDMKMTSLVSPFLLQCSCFFRFPFNKIPLDWVQRSDTRVTFASPDLLLWPAGFLCLALLVLSKGRVASPLWPGGVHPSGTPFSADSQKLPNKSLWYQRLGHILLAVSCRQDESFVDEIFFCRGSRHVRGSFLYLFLKIHPVWKLSSKISNPSFLIH